MALFQADFVSCVCANKPAAGAEFQMPVAGVGNLRTPGQAGATNGARLPCVVESTAGWMVGVATYATGSPNTITFSSILASSNSGAAVDFSSGGNVTFSIQPLSKYGISSELLFKPYVAGLEISWSTVTQIKVGVGAAYVEKAGYVVEVTSEQTVNPTLSASAWHYVYLKHDGTIDVSTTAPATAYFGKACSKNSAGNEYRWIGQFRTDASSNIYEFIHSAQHNRWIYPLAGDSSIYRVLATGQATTSTTVALSGFAPPQARLACCKFSNSDSTASVYIADGRTASSTAVFFLLGAGIRSSADVPINSSQQISYIFSATPTGGFFLDILGYFVGR